MSDTQNKYEYDFQFKTSRKVSESIGKTEEFIENINSKQNKYFTEKIDFVRTNSPVKKYVEFISLLDPKEIPSFPDLLNNLDKYMRKELESDSIPREPFSKIVENITKTYSPEELAIIAAQHYKSFLLKTAVLDTNSNKLLLLELSFQDQEEKPGIKLFKQFLLFAKDNNRLKDVLTEDTFELLLDFFTRGK